MSPLRLNGSTSGAVTLDCPAVGGNNTLVLPTGNGTNGQVLSTNGSGALSWSTVTSSKILQVVNVNSASLASTTTQIPLDNTIPQNTEGTELFTLSVTPGNTNNKLLITVSLQISAMGAGWTAAALFQDSVASALAAAICYIDTSTGSRSLVFQHYMTAGTTSSTTFKVRYGPQISGTAYINGQGSTAIFGGTSNSSMTIQEVAA